MSTPSLRITPDNIQLSPASRRLDVNRYSRRLNSITIGFTIVVYASASLASAALTNLQNSFSGGTFAQTLQTVAATTGASGLLNVQVSSLSVTVKAPTQAPTQAPKVEKKSLSTGALVGVVCGGIVLLALCAIGYYIQRKKVQSKVQSEETKGSSSVIG